MTFRNPVKSAARQPRAIRRVPLLTFVAACLLLLQGTPVRSDTFDRHVDGYELNNVGHYDSVHQLLYEAETGHPEAEYTLGASYLMGHRLPQDYHAAKKWLFRAADKGHVEAQYVLGQLLLYGRRIRQNLVYAHKWFNLAGARGHQKAIHFRHITESKMSRRQVRKAQKLARRWIPAAPGF